jgi:predicted phosphodiesterase
MKYGILADVHANLPALQAVLRRLDPESVDRFIVAGDIVGYGPHPNECVELVASLDPLCVVGNHDLMAIERLSDERCIPLGRAAMRWTRSVLGSEARRYLEALPMSAEAPGGVLIAHGSLDDPEEYTTNTAEALAQLAVMEQQWPDRRLLLLGHTHRPLVVGSKSGRAQPRARHRFALHSDERHVVNVGSVGQARELRARARFGVLDLETGVVDLHAVRYDLAACRRDLRRAGLSPRSCHLRPSAAGAARRALGSARRAVVPRGSVHSK